MFLKVFFYICVLRWLTNFEKCFTLFFMDKFTNPLPIPKFRATNAMWNHLKLNAPWSVGYVSMLIERESFTGKEDWEAYYYQSGEQRNKLLVQKNYDFQALLNEPLLKLTHPDKIKRLPKDLKNLNLHYGRTPDQLAQKGLILYEYMGKTRWELTLEECVACVRFRVVCETWNGIIIRERRAITFLKKHFPQVEFRKTDGDFDHRYAVDYELFKNGQLVCGIQVKPKSYLYHNVYINAARRANQRKNEQYRQQFCKPVFDVVFDWDRVVNEAVIGDIRVCL